MASDTLAILTMPLEGVRILVVEDEKDARDLLDMLLTVHGAEVTAAASAREAIEAMSRSCPDLLVSDISMPEEDGFSLIRRIRALSAEHGGHIPAIALTGLSGPQARAAAFAAGFQAYVTKPVEPTVLMTLIKSFVSVRHEDQ